MSLNSLTLRPQSSTLHHRNSLMLSVTVILGNEIGYPSSNPDEAVCIWFCMLMSFKKKTKKKNMNLSGLPTAIGK